MWDQGNGYLVVIFEGKEHVALATTNFLFGLKYVKECQSVQLCFETCNQCRLLYVKAPMGGERPHRPRSPEKFGPPMAIL